MRDTLTIILLMEKEHLNDVSSWLKRFCDHLRGLRDNLKISRFCNLLVSVRGNSEGKLNIVSKQKLKIQNFQIISKTTQVIAKPFQTRTNITKMFLFPQ